MSISIDDQEEIGVEEIPAAVNSSEDATEERRKMIKVEHWTKIMMKVAKGKKSGQEVIHFKFKYCQKIISRPFQF
jgi:hypothetical protein